MRVLAIETASEACSVALFDGEDRVAHDHRVLGRGHAEALVPMIAALPDKGRADRICVSLGPGSFTGVRIGIATARALGIAWGAQVLGFPSLALIAASISSKEAAPCEVTVCIGAGHGQWFVQDFDRDGMAEGPAVSQLPDAAAGRPRCHNIVAGNKAAEFIKHRRPVPGEYLFARDAVGDAGNLRALPADCFTEALTPIYGRAPDAKPQSVKAGKPA